MDNIQKGKKKNQCFNVHDFAHEKIKHFLWKNKL